MSVKKDFRTCDLYFAAYLKAMMIPYLGSAKVGKKTYFIFDTDEEDMRTLRDTYFAGTAKVSALQHANEIRTLKRICYLP